MKKDRCIIKKSYRCGRGGAAGGSSIFIASLIATLLCQASFVRGGEVLEVHGSGSTFPTRCILDTMEQLEDRSRTPIRLTYRAVGSSAGIREFADGVSDFGISDTPIGADTYQELTGNGQTVLQIPFLLSSISVAHTLPNNDESSVNLSPCLLARVLKGDITTWDDPDISDINPTLKVPSANYPIRVAHRAAGSLTTSVLTQYLNRACPAEWDSSMVGKLIDWPSSENFLECFGTSGMVECLERNPGAIGYIPSSVLDDTSAAESPLIELEIQNADGFYLTSKRAIEMGGIGNALNALPESFAADSSSVDFISGPGEFTWPMTFASFLLIRGDFGFKVNWEEQGLMVALLKSLFDIEHMSQDHCQGNGFTPVPASVASRALEAIENGINPVDGGVPTWIFETNTMPIEGQGRYVISSRRLSSSDLRIVELEETNQKMKEMMMAMQLQLQGLQAQVEELSQDLAEVWIPPTVTTPTTTPITGVLNMTTAPTASPTMDSNSTAMTMPPTTDLIAQESFVPEEEESMVQNSAGPDYYWRLAFRAAFIVTACGCVATLI